MEGTKTAKVKELGKGLFEKIKVAVKTGVEKTKQAIQVDSAKSKMNNDRANLNKKTNDQIVGITYEYLRRFNYGQITALGRVCGVPDMKEEGRENSRGQTYYKKVRREFEDYIKDIPVHMHIYEILDFGDKYGIPETFEFRQHANQIREESTRKEWEIVKEFLKKYNEITGNEFPLNKISGFEDVKEEESEQEGKIVEENPVVSQIVEKINTFSPPKRNPKVEMDYQLMLYGYLKASYPDIQIEEQRGSSRPDLSIGNVGIEIKGPTYHQELQTIADKLLRYPHLFKDGIIIVLYNVQVNGRFYDEWKQGVLFKYPSAVIIRK